MKWYIVDRAYFCEDLTNEFSKGPSWDCHISTYLITHYIRLKPGTLQSEILRTLIGDR